MDAPTSVAQLIEEFYQERDYLKAASTEEHLDGADQTGASTRLLGRIVSGRNI